MAEEKGREADGRWGEEAHFSRMFTVYKDLATMPKAKYMQPTGEREAVFLKVYFCPFGGQLTHNTHHLN